MAVALAPQLWCQRPAAAALLAGIVVLALVGLCDDRFGLSPLLRFVVYIAGGRLGEPGHAAAAALSVLWIVVVIDFYNFMDGIDGIAGVQAVVTGAGLASLGVDPFVSLVAAALAGAAARFLVFNWSPASVFLGDAGSGALGFAFAALPFLATVHAEGDGRRLRVAKPVAVPVRRELGRCCAASRAASASTRRTESFHQRLVISGLGHAPVTAALGGGALLVTALALAALRADSVAGWWAALAVAAGLFAIEAALVGARRGPWRRGGPPAR